SSICCATIPVYGVPWPVQISPAHPTAIAIRPIRIVRGAPIASTTLPADRLAAMIAAVIRTNAPAAPQLPCQRLLADRASPGSRHYLRVCRKHHPDESPTAEQVHAAAAAHWHALDQARATGVAAVHDI